jgi:hypothetical protein
LAANCPNLESLSLWGCFEQQDVAAMEHVRSCPKLRKLDLGACVPSFSMPRRSFNFHRRACPFVSAYLFTFFLAY